MTHRRFTASNAAELSKQAAYNVLDTNESRNYHAVTERIMDAANGGWFSLIVWRLDELHDQLSPRVIAILRRDGFNVTDSYTGEEGEECDYVGKIISWN